MWILNAPKITNEGVNLQANKWNAIMVNTDHNSKMEKMLKTGTYGKLKEDSAATW